MAQMKKAAAKKADPMKTSAASHQRSLAKMSGDTAGNKKFRDDKKAGKMYKETGTNPSYAAGQKAEKKALKSFGLSATKKAAAAKPAARSKAGASTVSAVAKRFGVTVREARDIATALGNVATSAKSATNLDRTGNQYLGGMALKASVKDLKKQVKETGRAAKTGAKGTRAGKLSYNIDTGTPQGLVGKQRPKYGGSLTQY